MIDLSKEQTLDTPDGRKWQLSKLRLAMVQEWRAKVTEKVGDPFALVDRFIDKLSPPETVKLIKEAESIRDQVQCFSMFSLISLRFLITEEGLFWLTGKLLEKHHAGASEDDIGDVTEVLAGKIFEALMKTMSESPEGEGSAPQTIFSWLAEKAHQSIHVAAPRVDAASKERKPDPGAARVG